MSYANLLQSGKQNINLNANSLNLDENGNLSIGNMQLSENVIDVDTDLQINGLTVSTDGFNTGNSIMGGHAMVLKFQKNGSSVSTTYLGSGMGVDDQGSGYLMPFNGKVVAVSGLTGDNDTCKLSVWIRNTPDESPAGFVDLDFSNEKFKFISGNSLVTFLAGNYIAVELLQGSVTDFADCCVYIIFD